MKLFKEALNDKQKSIVDQWPTHDASFSDHVFGGPKETHHTMSIPLDISALSPPRSIRDHLNKHGIEVTNWAKGYGRDKYGRTVAIGKALVKTKADPMMLDQFASDSDRYGAHHNDLHVVISRHPHHVAAMSTGQHWSSCTNLENDTRYDEEDEDSTGEGDAGSLTKAALKHGVHVAYLCKKSDTDVMHPLTRIAIKPYHNINDSKDVIMRPDIQYGGDGAHFPDTVRKWTETHFPTKPEQAYRMNDRIHRDSLGSLTYHANDRAAQEKAWNSAADYSEVYPVVKDLHKSASDADFIRHLIQSPSTDYHHLHGLAALTGNKYLPEMLDTHIVKDHAPQFLHLLNGYRMIKPNYKTLRQHSHITNDPMGLYTLDNLNKE